MEEGHTFGQKIFNSVLAAVIIGIVAVCLVAGTLVGLYLAKSLIGFIGGALGFGAGVGIAHAITRAAG